MDKPTVDPTKTRLLEAAGEEFATHGFELATVRAICQRAGTNVAAINYHFGDKEQLYIQAVLEAHRCSMRPLPVVDIENHAPADLLRQFIHQFLENVLSLNGLDSWHNTLMLREMLRPTKACETLVRDMIRPRFAWLREILSRLWPGIDGRRLDATCFSVIGQCLHYRLARTVSVRLIGESAWQALDADYLCDHITSFCLAALGQGEALPRRFPPEVSDADASADPAACGSVQT